MKSTIRYVIKNFLCSFVLFTIPFCIALSILYLNLFKGVCLGLIGGLLFATLIAVFSCFLVKWAQTQRLKIAKEGYIFFDGAANYLSNGGWIYLTANAFYYKAHKINLNTFDIKILYSEIQEVVKGKHFNTFILKLKDGTVYQFTVYQRDLWISTLKALIYNSVIH